MQFKVGGQLQDAFYHPTSRPPNRIHLSKVLPKLEAKSSKGTEHVIAEYTPVSSQGPTSTCVANAVCDCCEILLGLQHGATSVKQLSRRYLYWVARSTHDATHTDSGTYLRAAAWQITKVGVPAEKYYPFSTNPSDINATPPLTTHTMASENRIKGVYSLTARGLPRTSQIEASIRADHPVVFGTPVDEAFVQHNGKTVYDVPKGRTLGGHAMIVVGVRTANSGKREFLIRNSWGESWGDKGHTWVTDQFLRRSETSDLWVFTQMQLID